MSENINEIVSDAKVAKTDATQSVAYYRPKFIYRVLANLIDVLIFILVFFNLFGCARNH